jgi:methionyl-tRNA synthetase
LSIEYSFFVRTSDQKHKETIVNVYNKFKSRDLIYKGFWESLYSVKSEETISKSQAIKKDGKLVDQFGHELILKKEESYFFKMNQFQDWISNLLKNNKSLILPHQRINELMNSFIKEGIEDLSISRKKLD